MVNSDGSVWISQGGGSFVIAGDDAIWAIFQEGAARRAVRIDPETNEMQTVLADLPVLPNPIAALGVGGYVWVASWDKSSVTQYDAATGEEIAEHEVGLHPVEPIYAYGDVWTTSIHGNSVARIDTATAEVQTIEMEPAGSPIGMQAIRDDLALVGNADGLPYLIDPEAMTVAGTFDPGTGADCIPRIAAIDGALWVDPCDSDSLLIMDPDTGERLGEVTSPVTADPPFLVDGVIWLPRGTGHPLGHSDGQSFVGLDPETYEVVAEYQAPQRFTDGYYAVAFDSIWMFGLEGILRIPAETLRDAAAR